MIGGDILNSVYGNAIAEKLFVTKFHFIGESTMTYTKGVVESLSDIEQRVSIAFDQSSTQTGISIMDDNNRLVAVVDLINKGLPKEDFIRMVRRWIHLNLDKYSIRYVICERAEQNAPQQYVKKLLQKLIDIIEDFAMDKNVPHYQLDNKTWKKHYLAEDKFKGRRVKTELVKPAIVDKTCDLYPELHNYYYQNDGTDSADAVGIMYGFIHECFVNGLNSKWKVCAIMPTYNRRKYSAEFVTKNELAEKVKSYPQYYNNLTIVKYNPDYTWDDNARKIINFFPNGAILYTDSDKIRIGIWQGEADRELPRDSFVIFRYSP